MKNSVFLILCVLFVVSCIKDKNPIAFENLDYNILIQPTGKSENGFMEFKFSNTIDDTLWFWGYSKNSLLYNIQIMSDSGWVNSGGWCGTGLEYQYFAPFESINANVYKPSTKTSWRVGIYIYKDVQKEGKYSWSRIQY